MSQQKRQDGDSRLQRPGSADTGVCCPSCRAGADCRAGTLVARFSCLQTFFICGQCGRNFSLDQLVSLVDDGEFDLLEQAVANRLSDRI